MDVEVIETGALEREVRVGVEPALVSAECDRALATLRGRVKVKGFRPGKVPMKEIERRYGKGARRDALQVLMRKSLGDVLAREDLKKVIFVTPPEVIEDDEQGGGFTYGFNAELRPEVTPKGYLGVALSAADVVVAPADVDAQIERLRDRHATIEPVEDRTKVEAEDVVLISGAPVSDDPEMKIFSYEDETVDLRQGLPYAEGFAEGLVGHEVGETVDVPLTLPEESPLEERVGGRSFTMRVELKGIKQRVLPEVDDEFAELVGAESAAALRTEIETAIRKRDEKERTASLRKQLEDALIEATPFELPTAFLNAQVEEELHQRIHRLQHQGIDLAALGLSVEALRGDVRTAVERAIRVEFILSAVAERESVEASEGEVDARIDQIAASDPRQASQIRKYYKDPGRRSGLKARVRLDKTLDFLLAQATISSVGAAEGAGEGAAAASEQGATTAAPGARSEGEAAANPTDATPSASSDE